MCVAVACHADEDDTAQRPSPLNASQPLAAAPGKTTEVAFSTHTLGGKVIGLWTSFAAEARPSGDDAGQVRYQFKLPDNVPVSIGAVRLFADNGASAVQLFM